MSTTNPEESADQNAGADQPIVTEPPTRPRRFAPRRSRGAESAIAKSEPSTDRDSAAASVGVLAAPGEPAHQLTNSAPDPGKANGDLTPGEPVARRAQPSRPRRDRRPAAKAVSPLIVPSSPPGMITEEVRPDTASLNAPDSSLAAAAPAAHLEQGAGTPAVGVVSADPGETAASETALATASSQPAVTDPGPSTAGSTRAARGRGRARPAAKPASTAGAVADASKLTGQAPLDEPAAPRPDTPTKPSRSRRTRRPRPTETPVMAEEAREDPVHAVGAINPAPIAAVMPPEPGPVEAVGPVSPEPLVAET
ncbi:MAG TPA: hypothetical protein VIJ28_23220, partial [Chloroflexota bacterium]